MTPQERSRIDRITEVVYYLLKGKTPDPIPCETDPDDEIRQLSEKINELSLNFKEIKDVITPLSQGKLDIQLPKRNFLASPFKQLHSALSHLTWQTQQIARGDFNQQVDFMGDFSAAFNSMVDSLKQARSQLLSEIERFKHLAEIKDRYLNVMAHDIRTPIGAVIGFADILLDGDLSGEDRRYAQIIRRNAEALLALINNILDMAKIEKGKVELVSVPFSIHTLGEDISLMIQPVVKEGVRFIFKAEEDIPMVAGDPHRLRQILVNLVGNAAKFTKAGMIRLRIRIGNQQTPLIPGGELELGFSVEDTGIGIDEDKLEKIFTPFTQADGSIASRFGGTGLGLSIARELTALMGGKLQVKSRAGKGTTFYFSLVFKIPEQTETDQPAEFRQPFGKCNILVVDDDIHALKITENILTKQGIRFTLCQDSTKAYDLLVREYEKKVPFTLVWIDIDMPKLNGFDLAEKIRQDRRFKNLRLVACTGYMDKIWNSASPSHFSFVAAKPVSLQALKRILEEAGAADSPADNECNLSGIRLLVADDSPLNRFLIINMLNKLNLKITEAENGLDAVNKIAEDEFDVVMMDKMMPVMDGIEAVRRIREMYDRNILPVLAFTADELGDKDNFLSAGVNGFVSKPIIYDDMVDRLCEAVESKYQ
jgi:signal transduction histidine kinase/CheY-like chemotaxis protein